MSRDRERLLPPDLDWIPQPPALDRHPELALLAVLHVALESLVPALVASRPHLATQDPPPDRQTLAAHRFMVSVWHFQDRLARYRRALEATRTATPGREYLDDDF